METNLEEFSHRVKSKEMNEYNKPGAPKGAGTGRRRSRARKSAPLRGPRACPAKFAQHCPYRPRPL